MTNIENYGRFTTFLDAAKSETLAAERSRERWLRQQAAESARFVGQLVDLVERCTPVTVRTAGGRSHHGTIAAVGQDFCLVRGSAETYLALEALVGVQTHDRCTATGDRTSPLDLRMVELFGRLACEQPRLRLFLRGGGGPVVGRLRAVGIDVLTLAEDGSAPGSWFVPAAAIWEAVVAHD